MSAIPINPDMSKEPEAPASAVQVEWRLGANHAQDLRDVARGLEESDVGIRTRYLHSEAAEEHGTGDVHMFELEAFCNRFGIIGPWSNVGRARIRRCRAALNRLSRAGDHDAVGVLHVFHGYPDPSMRSWPRQAIDVLGDLAPLLRYTDATEDVRQRLVHEAALLPMGDPVWTAFAARRHGDEAKARWRALRRGPVLPELPRIDPRAIAGGGLRPLTLVVGLSDARECEAFLNRVISSGDALREALAPFGEILRPRAPGEHVEIHKARVRAYGERSSAHGARRREFLLQGRADAGRLLTRASRAYQAQWVKAASD